MTAYYLHAVDATLKFYACSLHINFNICTTHIFLVGILCRQAQVGGCGILITVRLPAAEI